MAAPFDASVYVRAPIINIANGVSLADTLVAACPKKAPKNVVKACAKLKETAEAAQNALTARLKDRGTLSEEDSRLIDKEADNSFRALQMRLLAYSMLPFERYPKAKRAGEILTILFADEGLSFLTTDYSAQNTMMAAMAQHIEESGLRAEIDDLAGKEFLQQIDNVLPRYDTMVQDKLRKEMAAALNLGDFVRAIQAAIVNYANKVTGMVDEDEPETIEIVMSALRPIDAHREAISRRVSGGSKEAPASGEASDAAAGEAEAGDAAKKKPG